MNYFNKTLNTIIWSIISHDATRKAKGFTDDLPFLDLNKLANLDEGELHFSLYTLLRNNCCKIYKNILINFNFTQLKMVAKTNIINYNHYQLKNFTDSCSIRLVDLSNTTPIVNLAARMDVQKLTTKELTNLGLLVDSTVKLFNNQPAKFIKYSNYCHFIYPVVQISLNDLEIITFPIEYDINNIIL